MRREERLGKRQKFDPGLFGWAEGDSRVFPSGVLAWGLRVSVPLSAIRLAPSGCIYAGWPFVSSPAGPKNLLSGSGAGVPPPPC